MKESSDALITVHVFRKIRSVMEPNIALMVAMKTDTASVSAPSCHIGVSSTVSVSSVINEGVAPPLPW